MSAVCPSCNVPVVPGYVKCPKCHTPLPYGTGRRAPGVEAGGTTVEDRRFPIVAVVVPALVVLAVVLFFGLRSDDDDDGEAAADSSPQGEPAQHAQPVGQPAQATAPAQPPISNVPAAPRPTPAVAGADLERALRKQRLWSTIEIAGDRIDVRSSSCSEAAMPATIDASAAALREVGLTELRCLAQSGAVVFTRKL
jgi:hypothetical protein